MGKTTLIKKLCLDWSKDSIPQFDFIFLFEGKKLTLTEPTYSLQTLLLSLSSFSPPCTDPGEVYTQILAAPKRVLIIFDGFDELRDYKMLLQALEKDLVTSLQRDSKAQSFTVKQLFSAILQRVLLPGCTLLLATRPRVIASQLLRRTDSLLEVCGFNPANVETYLSKYFTDPMLKASVVDRLTASSYLRLLCWNPGLCHMVCTVLERSKSSEVLPRTLTGLCHQVLCQKLGKDIGRTQWPGETQEALAEISNNSQVRKGHENNPTKSRRVRQSALCFQKARKTKGQDKRQVKVDEGNVSEDANGKENKELLSQLSSLAWEGVKSNTSIIPAGSVVSVKLKAFGLRTGLLLSQRLRTIVKRDNEEGGGHDDTNKMRRVEEGESKENGGDVDVVDDSDDGMLLWANPFLQSYIAAIHLSLSR